MSIIYTFSYSSRLNLGCPLEVMTGLGCARGGGGGGGGVLRGGGGGGGRGSRSMSRSKSSSPVAAALAPSQPTLRGQSHVWSSWLKLQTYSM